MNANEIMKAAKRDDWSGMGELIQAARNVHGKEWARAFAPCEDCGRLLIDPAVFNEPDSMWHEAQIGNTAFDREGNPAGLPQCELVCLECAKSRAEEVGQLQAEDADESWRRARRVCVR